MLSYICKNCGGEMSVDGSGGLYCEFCGSKHFFQDKEFEDYRVFRKSLLNYFKGIHDEKVDGTGREDRLWDHAEETGKVLADGNDVTIRYLYSFNDDGVEGYLTKSNAIYIFPKADKDKADKMLSGIKSLEFPPADVKGLNDCFPSFTGSYDLDDGNRMLAFKRPENLFPLSMFGSFTPEHVAWIISRLENICCVLDYSNLVHGGISADSVWINPFSHHAVLMGHWWSAGKKSVALLFGNSRKDLSDLRKTALHILGNHKDETREPMLDFLNGAPSEDAFTDFERWDNVIEKGLGGRHFAKMDVNL